MKFLDQKKGFLGYEANTSTNEKAVIVPFGLEKTVSYGSGTKNGPIEIIKASHQVELYDEELKIEPYKKIGIKTIKPFKLKNKLSLALKQLSEINRKILSSNKLPLVLGGEHSLTSAALKPIVEKYDEVIVVHFDAHADLREEYNGNKFSHATALRRCLDFKNVKIISIGIRNLSKNEMIFYENNSERITIFWAKDKARWNLDKIAEMVLNKNIYITFDVDVFDSSIMPATGTPEPGGLFWDEVMINLKNICKSGNVVGADINELAPIKKFDSYNFLAAKLTYKMLAYIFKFKN
tara:strand:- start:3017 stop:3898 length:882 start_codon:yes stop_codon:yes gene_type:complete